MTNGKLKKMKNSSIEFDERYFNEKFVDNYMRKHIKMQKKFGEDYSYQLKNRNFRAGRILDAGCAFGETIVTMSNKLDNSNFTGIDISENFINRAKDRASKLGLDNKIKFIKADVHNLPFPNNYFDVVINTNMLHVVNNPVQMINEIERVLNSTGFYFLADIRKSYLGLIEKEIRSAYSIKEIREIINRSTLREGKEKTTVLWWKYESN